MIGKCYRCRKIRNTKLPSGHDPVKWIVRPYQVPVEWTCESCYYIMIEESKRNTIGVVEEKRYLMPMAQVIPFLTSIAAIIMICLEIAWHT